MSTRKKTILILILSAGLLYSQHPDAGTTAFPFLNIGYDARAVSMGGAATAVPNDIYGIFSNVASLGFVRQQQVVAGFRPVMIGVWGGPLAYLRPFGAYGNFSANIIVLSSGEIEQLDHLGDPTGGSARSDYVTGGVSWANQVWENLSVGATLKGVYNLLGVQGDLYSANGTALDAGVQYRIQNDRFIAGASVRNLGFMMKSYTGEDRYPMPVMMELGLSYIPQNMRTVRVALDVNKRRGDYLNFEPGLEVQIVESFYLRLGYNFSSKDLAKQIDVFRGERDQDYQKSNLASVSLGAGLITSIEKMDLNLDMAIQFYSDLSVPALVFSVVSGF